MSTRSVLTVQEGNRKFAVYKHCDGYERPERERVFTGTLDEFCKWASREENKYGIVR